MLISFITTFLLCIFINNNGIFFKVLPVCLHNHCWHFSFIGTKNCKFKLHFDWDAKRKLQLGNVDEIRARIDFQTVAWFVCTYWVAVQFTWDTANFCLSGRHFKYEIIVHTVLLKLRIVNTVWNIEFSLKIWGICSTDRRHLIELRGQIKANLYIIFSA